MGKGPLLTQSHITQSICPFFQQMLILQVILNVKYGFFKAGNTATVFLDEKAQSSI